MTEITQVTEPSLETIRQEWINSQEHQRLGIWKAVDAVVAAFACTKSPHERTKMANILASDGHCTSEHVRMHYQLHVHYGDQVRHLTDVSLPLLRACIRAAKRTERTAVEVLYDALDRRWHCREVNGLGIPAKRLVALAATCPGCGAKVRVTIGPASSFAGARMRCPVCVCMSEQDHRPLSDVETLGVLEAQG